MTFRSFATAWVLPFAVLLAALPASSQTPAPAPAAPAPAAPATPAPAANVYNIEIVVFRTNQALGGAENWSAQTTQTVREYNAEAEASANTKGVGRFVGVLPQTSWQLTPIENKMRSSGLYVPVAHVAWSQTASDWGTRAGFTLERLGVVVPGLAGTVFLERGQFLHLGMALSYSPASPPAGMGAGPGTTFSMSETRRIRFYERNYYDHPAFGVIALVTPAQGSRPAGR